MTRAEAKVVARTLIHLRQKRRQWVRAALGGWYSVPWTEAAWLGQFEPRDQELILSLAGRK